MRLETILDGIDRDPKMTAPFDSDSNGPFGNAFIQEARSLVLELLKRRVEAIELEIWRLKLVLAETAGVHDTAPNEEL